MKTKLFTMLIVMLLVCSMTASSQMIKRTDAVWARTTTTAITLDGKLDEAAWATADSIQIRYGQDNGMPGSGWYLENGIAPTDPTRATVKFLVNGNNLYVGVICPDSSIGAGLFNQFDGILANLRDRSKTDRPVPAFEIFYGWVSETWADTNTAAKGALPGFFGAAGGKRTDSLKAIWDAVTFVNGTTNDDATTDVSWTTEFKFNLTPRGYDVTKPAGDIVMFSLSIYDADWRWPLNAAKATGNRTWAQCPWGNSSTYNHIRIFARPDVTPTSGALPVIAADMKISGAGNYAAPTLDGKLTEAIWNRTDISSLRIKYGDAAVRAAYPNTAPYRSGQFQPTVNGSQAAVTDPGDVTVKMFYKNDSLYFGFDVKDKVVQSVALPDRFDGIRVTLNVRDATDPAEHVLLRKRLTFRVGPTGAAFLEDDLGTDTVGIAKVALALKGGTTVDTLGQSADSGYTAEMRVDLRKLGYPAGRGDGIVFVGVTLFDGDSFTPATNSYGTRTWFMRESDGNDGSAWMWMDPAGVLAVEQTPNAVPDEFALLGNYPNPFNPSTTIKFTMSKPSEVTLEVFDVLGRLVASRSLGVRSTGVNQYSFNASQLATGMYNYRLKMAATQAVVAGKMMLVK